MVDCGAGWSIYTAASAAAAAFDRSSIGNPAGVIAAALGLPLTSYTAVLLSCSAVPAWCHGRASLPFLFVGSAMTSGAAFLELAPSASARERRFLRGFGDIGKLFELASEIAYERELGHEVVRRALRGGLAGAGWRISRALTVASLLLSRVPRASRRVRAVSALLGSAGALVVRFAVLRAGTQSVRDPHATFEPQRASMRRPI